MLPVPGPQIFVTVNNEWKFHVDTTPTASPADFTRLPVPSFPFNKGYRGTATG